MKKKVLITGGAGYIGSKLVDTLISKGIDVVVIDNLDSGKIENVNEKAKFYKEDITSPKIYNILKKEDPYMIFHLAALKSVAVSISDPIGFAKVNILGSINILDCASRLGIKKIVFTSTAGVYGEDFYGPKQVENQPLNPLSPYACSKLTIEYYINYYNKVKGMHGIVLRFANVYGPGGKTEYQGVINKFIEHALKNKKIIVDGDGNQTRDFVYIDDIINICIDLINLKYEEKTKDNFIFNISTGREVSVNAVLKIVKNSYKQKINYIYKKKLFFGQKQSVLNPSLLRKTLGIFTKVKLEQGVLNTMLDQKKNFL